MPRIAYVNGRYIPHADASIHIEDRGLQFADSVYEVIALINGHFADEAGHLDRLARSLSELDIDMPLARRALRIVMRELARRNRAKNGALYIQITRGTAARDFKFPDTAPNIIMTLRPASFDIAARKAAVKKAVTVPDIRWQRRDIKTTGLLAQVLAKQAAAEKGAAEAFLVDEKGYITEGSSSNAWIVDAKGNLVTRQTAHNAILKGVTRSALQQLCRKEGIRIVERAFTVKEAYQAREIFTSSTVALVLPIGWLDGRKIGSGKIGRITEKLMDLYMDYAPTPEKRQTRWNPK